jgi:hypothetical protein
MYSGVEYTDPATKSGGEPASQTQDSDSDSDSDSDNVVRMYIYSSRCAVCLSAFLKRTLRLDRFPCHTVSLMIESAWSISHDCARIHESESTLSQAESTVMTSEVRNTPKFVDPRIDSYYRMHSIVYSKQGYSAEYVD